MSTSLVNPFVPQHENKSGQYSFILDSLPAPVFYVDKDTFVQYTNKAFEAWVGSKTELIAGKPMKEVLGEDIYVRLKEYTDKALSGITINFETELAGINITLQLVEGSFTPEIDESGVVKGFIAFFKCMDIPQKELVDITYLKQAERALEESENRFNKIADSAPVMVWMSGADKLCYFFNKGWLDFTGRAIEQELGNGWAEGVHPDDFEYCLETYLETFDKREEFKMEYRLRRHDGKYRWILDHGIPHFTPEGVFNGFIGSCVDITEKKMMAEALEHEVALRTQELQAANQKLIRYNEELEQFAYAASHDLQEPLRKIQTFAGMLLERNNDELNESGKNFLSKIIKSTERMSGIISDLLAYSRQTKTDELFVETDLKAVVENVLSDLELMILQKGAQIEYGELPRIKAIPSQISRLFYNLINNSLKFSTSGVAPLIHISAEGTSVHEGKQSGYFELLIKDNGIGFDQKYSERIFQLFQRLNDKFSYNGNGIGLSLCKKIVQNHNGLIFAEGQLNKGATFHIKLPLSVLVREGVMSEELKVES